MVLACGLRAGLRVFSLWATSGDELAPGDFTVQACEWVFVWEDMEKSDALAPRTMDAFINLRRMCAQVSISF